MKKNSAFTLVELLVGIVIIGILSSITTTTYQGFKEKAQDAVALQTLADFRTEAAILAIRNEGIYTDVCGSQQFIDATNAISGTGGNIESCESDATGYRVITSLPSDLSFDPNVAYAQFNSNLLETAEPINVELTSGARLDVLPPQILIPEGNLPLPTTVSKKVDGYCINSKGFAQEVVIADVRSLAPPFCSTGESGVVFAAKNGQCGSDHGGLRKEEPGEDLCAVGIASGIRKRAGLKSTSYSWTCSGLSGGASAFCSTVVKTIIEVKPGPLPFPKPTPIFPRF